MQLKDTARTRAAAAGGVEDEAEGLDMDGTPKAVTTVFTYTHQCGIVHRKEDLESTPRQYSPELRHSPMHEVKEWINAQLALVPDYGLKQIKSLAGYQSLAKHSLRAGELTDFPLLIHFIKGWYVEGKPEVNLIVQPHTVAAPTVLPTQRGGSRRRCATNNQLATLAIQQACSQLARNAEGDEGAPVSTDTV
ncbi:hypothetical protein B0A48_18355 [Cryoendolithus antarcticus]|uniref:Uncharacterized protein n=1 Tax=Cryoendolithus antarcticus TaxID=1507870 RepID=A0A1V8SAM5_9PEZI|nr:hypothetical protein B0A48_18355 [Cryoendolithus antarcticus]